MATDERPLRRAQSAPSPAATQRRIITDASVEDARPPRGHGPAVAVVIPAYDPGPELRATLDSLLAQTFADWEAVVWDDGSHEDLGWVREVDERVVLHRSQNGGVARARNLAIAATTAPFVAFLDADDTWAPDKLERQLALARSVDAPFYFSEFEWVFPDGAVGTGAFDYELTYRGLMTDQHVCTSSVLVSRAALMSVGGFDERLRRAEDMDLWMRLVRAGSTPACVHEPLVRYHVRRANGATADYVLCLRERRRSLLAHRRLSLASGDQASAAAASEGIRLARALYAGQAVGQYRALRGVDNPAAFVHLANALRCSVGATVRELGPGVVRRLGPQRNAAA